MVGHHVVELACDAHALGEHRPASLVLPLPFQLRRPVDKRDLVLTPTSHGVAESQRGGHEDQVEEDDEQVAEQKRSPHEGTIEGEQAVGHETEGGHDVEGPTQSRRPTAP